MSLTRAECRQKAERCATTAEKDEERGFYETAALNAQLAVAYATMALDQDRERYPDQPRRYVGIGR